jgi:GNAT superfamily N-acetyltransferase
MSQEPLQNKEASMTDSYIFRRATIDDIDIIVHQRSAMFTDMGLDPVRIQSWEQPFRHWMRPRLETNEYIGFFAVSGEQVVAGAGLWVHDWLPSPQTASPNRGYILNVYTEPPFRKRGLARRLVETAIEYCRSQNIPTVVLHASEQGYPIYEAIGFTVTTEMRLRLVE